MNKQYSQIAQGGVSYLPAQHLGMPAGPSIVTPTATSMASMPTPIVLQQQPSANAHLGRTVSNAHPNAAGVASSTTRPPGGLARSQTSSAGSKAPSKNPRKMADHGREAFHRLLLSGLAAVGVTVLTIYVPLFKGQFSSIDRRRDELVSLYTAGTPQFTMVAGMTANLGPTGAQQDQHGNYLYDDRIDFEVAFLDSHILGVLTVVSFALVIFFGSRIAVYEKWACGASKGL